MIAISPRYIGVHIVVQKFPPKQKFFVVPNRGGFFRPLYADAFHLSSFIRSVALGRQVKDDLLAYALFHSFTMAKTWEIP
jgi:hypothetical protein